MFYVSVSPFEPLPWPLTSYFHSCRSILSAALSPNLSPRPHQQSTPPAPLLDLGDSHFQLSATHIVINAAFYDASSSSFLQRPMALYRGGTTWACLHSRHSRTFASQPGQGRWCCMGGSPSCRLQLLQPTPARACVRGCSWTGSCRPQPPGRSSSS